MRAEFDAATKLAGDLDEVPEGHQDGVRRVREVLVHARARIRAADPYHMSVAQRNTVSTQVAAITGPLQQFQANTAEPADLDQVVPPTRGPRRARMRLTSLRLMPEATPRAATRSSTFLVEMPCT